jgi:hypothetical protein
MVRVSSCISVHPHRINWFWPRDLGTLDSFSSADRLLGALFALGRDLYYGMESNKTYCKLPRVSQSSLGRYLEQRDLASWRPRSGGMTPSRLRNPEYTYANSSDRQKRIEVMPPFQA